MDHYFPKVEFLTVPMPMSPSSVSFSVLFLLQQKLVHIILALLVMCPILGLIVDTNEGRITLLTTVLTLENERFRKEHYWNRDKHNYEKHHLQASLESYIFIELSLVLFYCSSIQNEVYKNSN